MSKLLIISRDGYAVRQFIERHNIPEDRYIRVKRLKDILGVSISGYVTIKPYPASFNAIMEYLELEEYPNLTKHYSK